MVITQADCGYTTLNQNIESGVAYLSSITDRINSTSLIDAFKIIKPYSRETNKPHDNWESLTTNSSGGVLVKGKVKNKIVAQVVATKRPTVSYKSKLRFIKNTFSLTNEELAKILQAGRKSVHNWINEDSKPNKMNAMRLLELDNLAQEWSNSGFQANKNMLNIKIGKHSLIELLSKNSLNNNEVLFLGSSLFLSSNETQILEDPFA